MKKTNMRAGFTMIELIFVIVIIGILAAIAMNKLSATRDDAKITKSIANLKTCVGDMAARYTAQGSLSSSDLTNDNACAATTADGCFSLALQADSNITGSTATNTLKVTKLTGTLPTWCSQPTNGAQAQADSKKLTGYHVYGGSSINRN